MRAILCFFVIACCGLSACVPVSMVPNSSGTRPTIASNTGPKSPTGQFAQIVTRVEPVAEDFCLTMRQNLNCDFLVIVDDRNTKTVNAFQTQSRDGRPLVIFTQGLINKAQNADELAFVLGHEMAHHLEGHLTRQYESARAGAILLGGLTVMSGGTQDAVDLAQQLGAEFGARRYSKDFELEADRLGTILAMRAGYDPVRGARFFSRLPDPGDKFLGTHPPNAARVEMVRRTSLGY